ncbi:lead, cadmium, zinc and mercury transporting ATPase [Paenibacillus sp. JCM 10914]|nr:lead, cadmium, zinc and mercury transporting ATPase [Paenibacillus sp. JCM 10914]
MRTEPSQSSNPSSKSLHNEQAEYRVQGLSCPNCTREMQDEIQRLDHGKSARLNYNSGKLLISPQVDLTRVEGILKRDGAHIVPLAGSAGHNSPNEASPSHTHADGHGHHHGHSHGQGAEQKMKWLLSVSAIFYLLTFILEGRAPETFIIVLYASAMVLSGYTTFLRGLRNLTRLKFNMDTLMTVALIGAVIIGEWREATLVAILFGLNELLEGYGMNRARQSMEALLAAAPKEAEVIRGGETVRVPIESLSVGDIVRVRPGEKIPSDGIVTQGTGAVNEAAITGESVPLTKRNGESVYGGSVSTDGVLHITITKRTKILHSPRSCILYKKHKTARHRPSYLSINSRNIIRLPS